MEGRIPSLFQRWALWGLQNCLLNSKALWLSEKRERERKRESGRDRENACGDEKDNRPLSIWRGRLHTFLCLWPVCGLLLLCCSFPEL
jgi:hypothetical protein